jgi:hypothetical protein
MNEMAPALEREAHLFDPGPKRILALDGGGTWGAISLGALVPRESDRGRVGDGRSGGSAGG